MVTKVAIGSDHAGYELKQYIIDNCDETIVFKDFGGGPRPSQTVPEGPRRLPRCTWKAPKA